MTGVDHRVTHLVVTASSAENDVIAFRTAGAGRVRREDAFRSDDLREGAGSGDFERDLPAASEAPPTSRPASACLPTSEIESADRKTSGFDTSVSKLTT